MDLRKIQAYHTALMNLEDWIGSVSPNKPMVDHLFDYLTTIQNNNPSVVKKMEKFVLNLSMYVESKQLNNTYEGNLNEVPELCNLVRERRKPLDERYFEGLLMNFKHDQGAPYAFLETIKEEDSLYYGTALARLLNRFKYIPEKLRFHSIGHSAYTCQQSQLDFIDKAAATANELMPDYQIAVQDTEKKMFALCRMDRFLFDGFIEDKHTKEDIAPETMKECLKAFKEHYTEDMIEYRNAQTLIQVFSNFVQQRPCLQKATFPIFLKAFCHHFNSEKIYFKSLKKDENNNPCRDENGELIFEEPFKEYCLKNKLTYGGMDIGLRYHYMKKIESNPQNVKALYEEAENYLVNLFKENDIPPEVAIAYMSRNKCIDENYEDYSDYLSIYRELTHPETGLFSKQLHHNQERCNSSLYPNSRSDNFVLVLCPRSLEEICQRMYEKFTDKTVFNQNRLATIIAQETLFEHSYEPHAQQSNDINVHRDILHGADVELHYIDQQGKPRIRTYINMPKNDGYDASDYTVGVVCVGSEIRNKSKAPYQPMPPQKIAKIVQRYRGRK